MLALPLLAFSATEAGIPVTDQLVIAKCASCHPADEHGNLQRISWERTTPEGWEEVLKRMIRANRVTLTPPEARSIVKYLAANHGLAPEEAKPVMYYAERRIHDESALGNENLQDACTKCHAIAHALSWRRSLDDWKQFVEAHAERHKVHADQEAIADLAQIAPLHTAEWDAWKARPHTPELTGRWLVTAHVQGRGKFFGEMEVQPGSADGEFTTRVSLQSVTSGPAVVRTGRNVFYGGFAWRGRSKGASAAAAPEDLANEAREVVWISPDGSQAEGRWFWGQYQEFGFDVKMQRGSPAPSPLALDVSALKVGSQANRIRLIGENFPASAKPTDLEFGPGVKVRQILSSSSGEIVAAVDVDAGATPGMRDVAVLKGPPLRNSLAIYDRVDYIKVTPESSLAGFGSQAYPRGFQQFEAVGYQRGIDGKPHTSDDLELGPINVAWSLEVFYETDSSKQDLVGKVSPTGLFVPAAQSPNVNYDVWVVATAKNATNKDGKPLLGKGYLVVTVPSYTFNGRQYVRELDRWIEEGTR